jgi:hypothetical protein
MQFFVRIILMQEGSMLCKASSIVSEGRMTYRERTGGQNALLGESGVL